MNKAGLYCSFCGKSESEVKHIVEGPGKVGICDECSELVESIMEPYRPLRAAASTSTEGVGVVEAAMMARTRLQRFADEANAGNVQAGGRELARQIWGAFAEFDALTPPTPKVTTQERDG